MWKEVSKTATIAGRGGKKEDLTYENMKQFLHGSNFIIHLRKIELDKYLGSNKIILVASDKNLIETILNKTRENLSEHIVEKHRGKNGFIWRIE